MCAAQLCWVAGFFFFLVFFGNEGVNKESIHCHCRCRKNSKAVHTAFNAIYHTVIFLPSLSVCAPPQERVSNTPTGYHWHGARDRDDQALWTRQQVCQQHQQAAGRSGGERGELKLKPKEEMLHDVSSFCFILRSFYSRMYFNHSPFLFMVTFRQVSRND